MASITVNYSMRGAQNAAACNVLRLVAHGHAHGRVPLRKLGLTIAYGRVTVANGLNTAQKQKAQQWAALVQYGIKRGMFKLN